MAKKDSILITGSSGLVASHFLTLLKDQYSFDKLDISNKDNLVDITKPDSVKRAITRSSAKFLIHFAAFTDVTKAWEQRGDKKGLAYQVNVVGTQNIVKACSEHNIHLINVSTAYVFDGEKPAPYLESDQPNPVEWYGQTKWEAEQIVMSTKTPWTTLRIDQPFGTLKHQKQDVLHKIVDRLTSNTLPPQFTNHTFGPTFINDFAKVIEWIIRTKTTGLFHASSGESWTDFQFASLINQVCGLSGEIEQGNLEAYLKTTNRPYQKNTALDCSKLLKMIDFSIQPINQAIQLCCPTASF